MPLHFLNYIIIIKCDVLFLTHFLMVRTVIKSLTFILKDAKYLLQYKPDLSIAILVLRSA